VRVPAHRGYPETFDDAARHRLPPESDSLPELTVGPHVGWKLLSDLQEKTSATEEETPQTERADTRTYGPK